MNENFGGFVKVVTNNDFLSESNLLMDVDHGENLFYLKQVVVEAMQNGMSEIHIVDLGCSEFNVYHKSQKTDSLPPSLASIRLWEERKFGGKRKSRRFKKKI